jgi:phosphatidylserine decarboxylase
LAKEGVLVVLLEIFASSLVLALLLLPLIAWKWRIEIRTAILGGIITGGLTGFIVSRIHSVAAGLNMAVLVLIEFCFVLLIPLIIIGVRFYRDPERFPKETKNVILSPADGMVIYVSNVEKSSSLVSTKGKRKFELDEITSTDLLPDAAYLIGIDMNILNVHVNRSPIKGKIVFRKRTRGVFMSLRKPESDIVNERVTTVIANGKFKVGVVQISSRLVRKIISYLREGDRLDIGQRLGSIVFGSKVDVVIPELENLRIEVKPGDEVKAGVSVIARHGMGRGSTEGGGRPNGDHRQDYRSN